MFILYNRIPRKKLVFDVTIIFIITNMALYRTEITTSF